MTKMINCYVCGSWIKPDKHGIYKCSKCKAKYEKDKNGKIVRIYDTYAEYVED